ncbi:FixH family protein [Niveispirillum sp. KHB5.9]|uniref:FixH family protein n=1 Tax=Niveispirillum sp. KHB5.9 TaxID=3400269 RepID=UPI003A8A926A
MTMIAEQPRKSAWIPWVFVGCMLVVIAVNAVMVTYALKSFSGLAVDKPYERGVNYNAVLAAQKGQDALGWRVSVNVEGGQVVLRLQDRDGQPLNGAGITGRLERPVSNEAALPLSFTNMGGGRYVAQMHATHPGQWDVKAAIRRGEDHYLLVHRVMVAK